MVCDLCLERADRIVRVQSWRVCQWCVSNHVLEHALEVEFDIAKLNEAITKTNPPHERDVKNGAGAKTKLELAYAAYADLTDAMKELAVTREHSLESWKHALAVKKALKDHRFKEVQKTRRARQPA